MDLTSPAPLSIDTLITNLLIGILLSTCLALYYGKYGTSLSNRVRFSFNLPLLALITLLVISIVKSSLALSLGLVGALSIVRFRTAIKDPEELINLFLAISIGLGLGADQRIPTVVAFAIIMVFQVCYRLIFWKKVRKNNTLYVNIEGKISGSAADYFKSINSLIQNIFPEIDLRRMDTSKSNIQMTYYINFNDPELISKLLEALQKVHPALSVSIIEQNNLLGG